MTAPTSPADTSSSVDRFLEPEIISALIITSGLITLLAAVFNQLPDLPSGPARLQSAALFLLLGILIVVGSWHRNLPPLAYHIIFAISSTVIMVLFWLDRDVHESIFILFFVFSGMVALKMDIVPSLVWIVGFYAITLASSAIAYGPNGMINWLSAGGGFLFFGLFGIILRQTHTASRRAQQLAQQLQATNDELRASRQQAEQLAVAEERNRLAREMHDSLGHRLTVAVVQLEGAQRLIPKDPDRAASMIGDMRSQLKEGLGELRQTLSTLRTSAETADPNTETNDLPLPAAIQSLINTFERATGLTVSADIAPTLPALPDATSHALYRATQEGLTNVARHANASAAWITLAHNHHTVTLTVEDDGRGLPNEIPDGRFGIRGLHERAAQVNGTCSVTPRQPRGTKLMFAVGTN